MLGGTSLARRAPDDRAVRRGGFPPRPAGRDAVRRAPVLRWSYVAIGAIGLGFYVYRELLARFFVSLHDYQVDAVTQVDDGLIEIVLQPLGRPVEFIPGQFAMVYLEDKDGWHRHPFTIASAPPSAACASR